MSLLKKKLGETISTSTELPLMAEDGDLIIEPKILVGYKKFQVCWGKFDQMEKTSNRWCYIRKHLSGERQVPWYKP